MQTLPWIVAFVASVLLTAMVAAWAWRTRERRQRTALPTEWRLTARPAFSVDERRVHRALREALPHHVLLSRLPLVSFCQPTEPGEGRYWHDLLGNSHVSFAICSANGRVLAAIDLDSDRDPSRRVARIKQAALSACRVRYLRFAADHLPSMGELQLLVPNNGIGAHSPQPAPPPPHPAPMPIAARPRDVPPPSRRSPHPVLWQDTTVFQDSFFPSDDGFDDADTEIFEPAAGRRAASPQRSSAARFFGTATSRRRAVPPPDFEPTRQGIDDDDDDDEDDGDRMPRPARGFRP